MTPTKRLMLADRQLPIWVAFLTMAATWIGGGYLNGTAEAVYDAEFGLVWCQAPWCYALSLILGGIIFARPMRNRGYRTMLDLFDERYGSRVSALLFIPALIGDLFWTAAILSALGETIAAMTGLDAGLAMIGSLAIVVGYTVWGGLWSVAVSDVVQLFLIVCGLTVALPFVLESSGGFVQAWQGYVEARPDQARLLPASADWRGPEPWGWQWLDAALLLILGGIPWQVYFQRILACRTTNGAVCMSIMAGVVCLLVALLPMAIGVVGATVDWSYPIEPPPTPAAVLPHVLQYLTPPLIGMFGLVALICAVMSSMDSSILSSASLFTWNIYRPMTGADEQSRRLPNVLRTSVVLVGLIALVLAYSVNSVYQLWFLCADLVYVILFPQLTMALFWPRANRAGALAGFGVSVTLRIFVELLRHEWSPLLPVARATAYWPRLSLAMLAALITIGFISSVTYLREGRADELRDRTN